MNDRGDLGTVSGQSCLIPRSDKKVMEDKRSSDELEEMHEVVRKRVKMRDLSSVIHSEEINTRNSESLRNKESNDQFQSNVEEMSQMTETRITRDSDASQVERIGKIASPVVVDDAPKPLDLNSNISVANNPKCAESFDKSSTLIRKPKEEPHNNCESSIRIGLDLNAEDVASSVNQEPPICTYKKHNNLKTRDTSECVSSTRQLEEKDSMRLWKEMKQNGFLSSSHGGISSNGVISLQKSLHPSSHGGIPPMPKQRGRKSKADTYKKKMERAKRENVDRFTKIAAPSGLLNELNPGIINNVRNKKQVYSIIEAIVRSEKHENGHFGSKQLSYQNSGTKDTGNLKDAENMNDSGIHQLIDSHEDRPPNTLCFSTQTSGHSIPMNKSYPSMSEDKSADGDSNMVDCKDDTLALKLSSSTKASESASTLSNEESTTFRGADCLSEKAATVASQWLDLLHQDIKGRLQALRRSKKRVRVAITTQLPFLLSQEFSSGQENDPNIIKNTVDGFSNNVAANRHRERWNLLFGQMDKALTEEEKQLESWLNQVREMQLHCVQGLRFVHRNTIYGLQYSGTSETVLRSAEADSDKELAVKAAAAAIYSTCNFLASKENVPCC